MTNEEMNNFMSSATAVNVLIKDEQNNILKDIQRAIDELRAEENSGVLSDVLQANSRAEAILSHILKRFA